jgi:hypothetical protein
MEVASSSKVLVIICRTLWQQIEEMVIFSSNNVSGIVGPFTEQFGIAVFFKACIFKVFSSNIGFYTPIKHFCGFTQFLQVNSRMITQ